MTPIRFAALLAFCAAATPNQLAGQTVPAPAEAPARENTFMDTPESVVLAFMADYTDWNRRAYERADADPGGAIAQAEYRELLRKYCRPGFSGKLIAFGSESSHDPAREAILSMATRGETAIVRTRLTKRYNLTSEYEYHLTFEDGRWYLDEIYFVDEEGKWESL